MLSTALQCSEIEELGSKLDCAFRKMFWLNILATRAPQRQISLLCLVRICQKPTAVEHGSESLSEHLDEPSLKKVASFRASPHPNTRSVCSLCLFSLLVDRKESRFSPRVPCFSSCFWWTVKKVAALRASPNLNTRRMYSL